MIFVLPFILLCVVGLYLYNWKRIKKQDWIVPEEAFPEDWQMILANHILYYNALSVEEKKRFEYKIQEFVLNYEIIGIKTTIDIVDKLLVASSAVIPIFGFDQWHYTNLFQVLIYPDMFNENLEIEGPNRRILGMVGNGYMEGTMILSKEALRHGFKNESDKKNTAIHEFVHLIDKAGGTIDGIPTLLMERQYTIPWIDMMNQKLEEIYKQDSDINPYGGTNKAEFFSVASEYFFERPKLLKRKHPDLYDCLEQIFNQDMSSMDLSKNNIHKIERNSPCPCNSGKKYKRCCGIEVA